jgi:Coenzyme PQQ synthesis protein D (PqqD)
VDNSLSRTNRYRIRKEAVAWQNVAPDAILVQLEREEVHVANPTAATIVEALQVGATVAELVERVTSEYEVEAAQATADIETFLRAALEAGLVAEEPST